MNEMITITPFDNDHEVLSIGGLTIENSLDSVLIFGELSIDKSQSGLAQAKALQDISGRLVAMLEQMVDLPNTVAQSAQPVEQIDNPFA